MVVLLAVVGPESVHAVSLSFEVLAGIGIGIGTPFVAIRLERTRFFHATTAYEPLNAFAIGLLVLGLSSPTHLGGIFCWDHGGDHEPGDR